MTGLRLSREAEDRLCDSFRWTAERLGPEHAASLRDDILARCRALAEGRVLHRSCRGLVAPGAGHDLRFVRVGRTVLFFLRDATQIVILYVLHDCRDLGTALARLDLSD